MVTNFGGGDGAPTVCQGEVLNNLPVFGSNFLPNLGPANVSFGPAVQTRAVRVISPTELRIDVSITDGVSSIGTHALTITNPLPDGSQATLPGAVIVAAVPTVTGISDDTIAQGTSQPITISGSNFVPGTLVSITPGEAGVFIAPGSVTIVSESQITATLVSSDSSTLGTYSLVVTAPAPVGGVAKSCSTFTFSNAITNVAAPQIIRIDPSTVGAGMQEVNLTITGSGFQPGAQVFIGHGGSGDPRSEEYVTFCDGGSMIYVRPGGGFIDPTRIVVCVNVDQNSPPMFIPIEVVNPDGGTAFAYDKFSVSVPNQPTPPSDLSAELFPGGKVNLVFQDNATNETGFVVEQSLNGGPWTVVKNLKALRGIGTITCTLTGLKAGNDYDYRVKAVNKSDGNIASPAATLNSSVDVDSQDHRQAGDQPARVHHRRRRQVALRGRPDRVERTERWRGPVLLDPPLHQGWSVCLPWRGGRLADRVPRPGHRDGHEVQLQDRGPEQLQHQGVQLEEHHAVSEAHSPG